MPSILQNLTKSRTVDTTSSSRALAAANAFLGEAIKLEALDRIVEVVSGNTPHASSAPTRGMIAFFSSCVNAVFGKIFTHRSLLAASLLVLLAPGLARAEEKPIKFRGVEDAIFVDGDPMIHRLGDSSESDAELVLVYTNAAAANKLRSTIPFQARVLVVGGGGSGGYGVTGTGTNPGGGGGGGKNEITTKGLKMIIKFVIAAIIALIPFAAKGMF